MAQGTKWNEPCTIAGCDRPRRRREWCDYHYMRWYHHGDPLAPLTRVRRDDPERAPCSVDGCAEPFHANGLCRRHEHARWRNGTPTTLAYEWAPPAPCRVCGDPPGGRFRQFCSYACWNAWRSYGEDVLTATDCVRCGVRIEFLGRAPTGRRTYRMRSYCPECRGRYTAWGMTVADLVARDGSTCALCGDEIDLALKRNAAGGFMCASIDHIVPRSLGGTDDPTNLQLTHLLCNVRKGGRNRVTT